MENPIINEITPPDKRRGRRKKLDGTNPALAEFTPRDLMLELAARGYTGKLSYTKVIDISKL